MKESRAGERDWPRRRLEIERTADDKKKTAPKYGLWGFSLDDSERNETKPIAVQFWSALDLAGRPHYVPPHKLRNVYSCELFTMGITVNGTKRGMKFILRIY